MKRLLLFGGTFDPPHMGHMALLQAALRAVQPHRVLVMPTGIPPHKAAGHTPAAQRLKMCRCFLQLAPDARLSRLEVRRAGKSYTLDTVRSLRRSYPGYEIYLPMGSDMFLYFHQWHEWRALLPLVTLVVHCRDEEDEAAVRAFAKELCREGARVLFAHGTVRELSSTQIRAAVGAGTSIRALVPAEALRVIKQYNLYKKRDEA